MNITDKFSRKLRDLRISVTDKCNFRCNYCMPSEIFDNNYKFISKSEILSFEEIIRLVNIFAELGTKKIRLTGGEPLLRNNLHLLIKRLSEINGITDISLTTNGILLSENNALELKKSGLNRITVSLDSLDNQRFKNISGTKNSPTDVLTLPRICEVEKARTWACWVNEFHKAQRAAPNPARSAKDRS